MKGQAAAKQVAASRGEHRVLVIPGGEYQLPLIRRARSRGLSVICADRNPECPGAHEAEFFFPIALDDPSALLAMARDVKPAAIVTDQTDAAVAVVAWLNIKLGLRGIGEQCAELFTHKHRMRAFGLSNGFATPRFEVCTTAGSAIRAADRLCYPVVVKPVDGQSSKGVQQVNSAAQMEASLHEALQHSACGRVIVEEFLDGPEFTVEGFMTDTGHRTLAISKKKHYPAAPMVASALEYSPPQHRVEYTALCNQHDRWINKSSMPFGMTHAEYKQVDGVFYMVEVAARGGGTRISSDIVPWISGWDCQGLLLDAALGKPMGTVPAPRDGRFALLQFFDFPCGQLERIDGLDEVRRLPGVVDVVVKAEIGGILDTPRNDTARPGYFILCTETETHLRELRDQVLDQVKVCVRS